MTTLIIFSIIMLVICVVACLFKAFLGPSSIGPGRNGSERDLEPSLNHGLVDCGKDNENIYNFPENVPLKEQPYRDIFHDLSEIQRQYWKENDLKKYPRFRPGFRGYVARELLKRGYSK